ncbi:hypothetical protein EVAR_80159_1 [Eumeta japonica]|uniref:Uncharacterized protein n=1 Tax=Eumeta variegata TaxID=151549 RepID=A0A4C1Y7E7_EUMVA|nr:hypothetical protein EVAR_80159_1 [Eumeta japonica]
MKANKAHARATAGVRSANDLRANDNFLKIVNLNSFRTSTLRHLCPAARERGVRQKTQILQIFSLKNREKKVEKKSKFQDHQLTTEFEIRFNKLANNKIYLMSISSYLKDDLHPCGNYVRDIEVSSKMEQWTVNSERSLDQTM